MFARSLLLLLCWSVSHQVFAQRIFDIRDYGAVPLKNHNSTEAIQNAIDACAKSGGGSVYFPPGSYLSGTIRLQSQVGLVLEKGATLYASQDTADYDVPYNIYKGTDPHQPVLIYAEDAQDISISGQGTIDGQARREYDDLRSIDSFITKETQNARTSGIEMKRFYKIPPFVSLVYLVNCKNVQIEDVHLKESSSWTLHLQWCEGVNIQGLSIVSSLEAGVNADGLDIDGCSDVMISDCKIKTGDDAIVLKSTLTNGKFQNCENVTVTNCVLSSTSSALKIGTETFGDFHNIVFNNCVIKNSNRGLGIIVRDGGTVRDVIFSNISMQLDRKHFNWWGNADPIWLVILKREENSKVGKIENVLFQNIIAHGQGTSILHGFPGQPLKNIKFSDIQLVMYPEDEADKRATHGIMAEDVQDLSLDRVSVRWGGTTPQEQWQSALHLKNVDLLNIDSFRGAPGLLTASDPVIDLIDVSNAVIRDTEATQAVSALIKVSGRKTRKIAINNVDLLNRARQKVAITPGVPLEELLLK